MKAWLIGCVAGALVLATEAAWSESALRPAPVRETIQVTGTEPCEEMLAWLAPYRAEVAKLEIPVIESVAEMINERRENMLGSWVADALRASGSRIIGLEIDFAFTNSGGIRAAMPQGPVSYRTIATILPFDNTLVYFELTGAEFLPIAERMASRPGWVPVSGGRIAHDGEGNLVEVIIGGEPLDRDRVYRIATIDFLADGGDGWNYLSDLERQDTGIPIRDIIFQYVEALAAEGGVIAPPADPARYDLIAQQASEASP